MDDGKTLTLATGVPGAKIKRWKTGTTNRTRAKEQESIIKTDLLKGKVTSDRLPGPVTFQALAEAYLSLHEVRQQALFAWKDNVVRKWLMPYFGRQSIEAITPAMIEQYRDHLRRSRGSTAQH